MIVNCVHRLAKLTPYKFPQDKTHDTTTKNIKL